MVGKKKSNILHIFYIFHSINVSLHIKLYTVAAFILGRGSLANGHHLIWVQDNKNLKSATGEKTEITFYGFSSSFCRWWVCPWFHGTKHLSNLIYLIYLFHFLSRKTTDTIKKDLVLHPGCLSPMRNGMVWAVVTVHISARLIMAWKQHDWAMRPEGCQFPCAHTRKIFGEVFQLSYINTDRLQDYTGFKRQTCLYWRFPQRRIV